MENELKLPITSKFGYIFDGWINGDDIIRTIPQGNPNFSGIGKAFPILVL